MAEEISASVLDVWGNRSKEPSAALSDYLYSTFIIIKQPQKAYCPGQPPRPRTPSRKQRNTLLQTWKLRGVGKQWKASSSSTIWCVCVMAADFEASPQLARSFRLFGCRYSTPRGSISSEATSTGLIWTLGSFGVAKARNTISVQSQLRPHSAHSIVRPA